MESTSPSLTVLTGDTSLTLDPVSIRRLRAALLGYYSRHARDLPWRRTNDPYLIWVSEVMLQQTKVETVIPYYRRWTRLFPDVETLAAAELDAVLKAWEGLGYYRRARLLHEAACVVRDRGGRLPTTASELRQLPGIGEYTAGAIASIAFGRPVPAVDGNVRRVLARLMDVPRPPPAGLRDLARALVSPDQPGEVNQALMELGATICGVRRPACGSCPVAADCRARAAGTQEERPARGRQRAIPTAEIGVAVPVWASPGNWRVALVRRPLDGMLGGLWEFPGVRMDENEDAAEAARRAASRIGLTLGRPGRALSSVHHVYSHLRATYHPYLFDVSEGELHGALGATADRDPLWMDRTELEAAPLPAAQRSIVESLVESMP